MNTNNIGFLLPIYKPKGLTSTQVLNLLKEKFQFPKLGHTGTLDPFAEGVLPVLVGRATRLSEYYLKLLKEYIATGLLGIETDTYDVTGKVIKEKSVEGITEEELQKVLEIFKGEIEQVPPPFSAKKVKGKRAYKLAKKGKKVELKAVKVKIYNIELLEFQPPRFTIKVKVSSGTYIRSLIHDIGKKLGIVATTEKLIRTKVGNISIENCVRLEKLLKEPNLLESYKLPPDYGLEGVIPALDITEDEAKKLKMGQKIPLPKEIKIPSELVRLKLSGQLVAIGKVINGEIKPEKVFL
jgi:tRNA pseudouridine55 synthase